MIVMTVICIALGVLLAYTVNHSNNKVRRLQRELEELKKQHEIDKIKVHQNSKFKSSAVNWGFTVENFVPFIDTFPIPPEDVNFLGKPIDYVGFTKTDSKTDCEVHFVEVKSGQSFLSQKQKNIKTAIEEGRVRWHEVRVAANISKST